MTLREELEQTADLDGLRRQIRALASLSRTRRDDDRQTIEANEREILALRYVDAFEQEREWRKQ